MNIQVHGHVHVHGQAASPKSVIISPYLIKLLLHNIIIRNAADLSSASVNRKIVET